MNKLSAVLDQAVSDLSLIESTHELEQIKAKYIGKSGLITAFMQELKTLPPEQRKEFGVQINHIKTKFEDALLSCKDLILQREMAYRLSTEAIDVTLSSRGNPIGSFHPISLSLQKMVQIFSNLGFSVADGPEIETDYYNFKALNFPDNHPARAMQDTFYTANH